MHRMLPTQAPIDELTCIFFRRDAPNAARYAVPDGKGSFGLVPDLRKSTALRLLSAAGCYLASFLLSLRLFEFLQLGLPK